MDQKSQIIDEQTQVYLEIQSTEVNLNQNFHTPFNNSLPNIQQANPSQYESQTQYQQNNDTGQSCDDNYLTQPQMKESYANFQNYLSQQPSQKASLDLQKFALCLESLEYSLTRICYRNFHNKLITFYIQSLKQEQREIRQTKQLEIKLLKEQNWPFKELFYKKFKTPNEEIMFEFVNMCAQKIQSTFKGYMTFKRHKQAMKRITRFKSKLGALLIGWKTWNIYNCKKIQQVRKTAQSISKQIDSQIQNPNLDRFKKIKKIQYLNSSQQVVKDNFAKTFTNLFYTGAWIYEVDKIFKTPIKKGHPHHIAHSYYPNQQTQYNQHQNRIEKQEPSNDQVRQQKPKQRTRKREFQAISNRNANQDSTLNQPLKDVKEDRPIKSSFSTNYQSSQLEERPIVAKGKYELTQEDLKNNQNNEFLNEFEKPSQSRNDQQKQEATSPRVNKFKEDEKKKLIKKQKYDPRKAIEQEKKKLEEEKKKKVESQKLEGQNPQEQPIKKKLEKKNSQIPKKTPRKSKKEEERPQLQSPRQSSKQKTVEKVKKQNKLTKKGDNSKSVKLITNNKKVESKVDCWGPKKDASQTQIPPNNQESSYKSKYLINLKERNESKITQGSIYKQTQGSKKIIKQQKYEQKNFENECEKQIEEKSEGVKFINSYRKKNIQPDEEETYQSSYLRKLVEEKQKDSFSYGPGKISGLKKANSKVYERKEQTFASKFEQLNNNIRNLSQNRTSLTNLKNISQERKMVSNSSQEPQQPQKKKQQVHRSVQSLEDVYLTQYTDRLNNLKNKLNMLESTRYIQRDDSIPILLEDSKFIRKIYKDHQFSRLYWPQVRTMETNFLDYIKFSGF